MTPTSMPAQLGRYKLLRPLGQGGMGAVWVALDTRLNREVAIKFPLANAESNPAAIERFQREAKLAASIRHPNFCAVYDVGEDQGYHYYVMEIVPGQALSDYLRGGQPWPLEQAAALIAALASALAELHSRGIVHRDLKPPNVMVKPDGNVVLMDFGLARAFEGGSDGLTASGAIMGTTTYMAPEQVDGVKVGPACDVWALGVMLYQLLAGRVPFTGTTSEIMIRIVGMNPPPPSEHRPDKDTRLDAICLQALNKDAGKRPASMTAVAQSLLGLFQEAPSVVEDDERILCPHCGKRLKIPAEMRGTRIKCSSCGKSLGAKGEDPGVLTETLRTQNKLSGLFDVPTDAPSDHHSRTTPRHEKHEVAPLPPAEPSRQPPRRLRWTLVAIAASVVGFVGILSLVLVSSCTTTSTTEKPTESKPYKNTLGMDLIWIKPGSFQMGSPDSDKEAYDDEKPQHKVTIGRGFWMASKEVTRGQYKEFVKATGHPDKGWEKVFGDETDEHPVVSVSWNDAMAFCKWMSEKEKVIYDLPTEAEWEYCCRAGTTTKYSFGDDAGMLGKYAWYDGNAGKSTRPVGTKEKNPWGLYDMHGNVWEWCKDSKRVYTNEDIKDKFNGNIEEGRVLRGGSWYNLTWICRSAFRFVLGAGLRYGSSGFRVVVLPSPRTP